MAGKLQLNMNILNKKRNTIPLLFGVFLFDFLFSIFFFFYHEIENSSKKKRNKFVSHKCITKFPKSFALENHTITSGYGLSVKHFLAIYCSPTTNYKPLFAFFRYILRVEYCIHNMIAVKRKKNLNCEIYHLSYVVARSLEN